MSPLVVAHRGASAHRAELTFAAYELAIEQGADGIECDVRLTADGHLVCIHDDVVDRTSSGTGRVSEMTLAQLSELDFGSWRDGEPQRVLTFDALLELVVASRPDLTVFVESKHPARFPGRIESKVAATLGRFGLSRPATKDDARVVLMSFSTLAVRKLREYAPRLPTVQLIEKMGEQGRDGWLPPWADYTGPDVELLRVDPGYVERSRAQGHDTYVWTVDTAEDVELCRDLGVRFLATNSPIRTRGYLSAIRETAAQLG
ncbi:glycerophosphodiester phosphodiesterase [Umezawaea tangerina]|uniref:Glycerophosphoryl diester phosphodiesterase n=1 Tax=Umezawaea tangerina TaxID=84725 RepID=A0A2T0TKD7_9PSEU|nr:glycerophosphodiester phosphodiesterase family protein [Umezawaea tangerina]PRY45988.1 glycerophosphoryl diester phosphodiesterase [Umezawaea tangerina]